MISLLIGGVIFAFGLIMRIEAKRESGLAQLVPALISNMMFLIGVAIMLSGVITYILRVYYDMPIL